MFFLCLQGVRVFIEKKAQLTLLGTEMDYVEDKLSSEFVFNNPNIKGTCGCGESFNIWNLGLNVLTLNTTEHLLFFFQKQMNFLQVLRLCQVWIPLRKIKHVEILNCVLYSSTDIVMLLFVMRWDPKGKNSKCYSNISVLSHAKKINLTVLSLCHFLCSLYPQFPIQTPCNYQKYFDLTWGGGNNENHHLKVFVYIYRSMVFSFKVHWLCRCFMFFYFWWFLHFICVGFLVSYFPVNPRKSKNKLMY